MSGTATPALPLSPVVAINPSSALASSTSDSATINESITQDGSADTEPGSSTLASTTVTAVDLPTENKNVFRNLLSNVAESGSNLSQGQRQLLCLARALLKNPSVLLMDEATASIDYATDAKIQGTIRELKNTTITIAHRLQTIVDYDKVLVLDHGRVMEFGSPHDLINTEGGLFRGMCEMSGDFETLQDEAKKAWEGRKLVDDE